MKQEHLLKKKQKNLKEQIIGNLDFIIGTVGKSPAMKYHNLTTKVDGKTVSRYVRQGLVPKLKRMTNTHKKLRTHINELSKINGELLKLSLNSDNG